VITWATREKRIKANEKTRKKPSKPPRRNGSKKKKKIINDQSGYPSDRADMRNGIGVRSAFGS
jgi:hypothetical protein